MKRTASLRLRAEARLRKGRKDQSAAAAEPKPEADPRLLHELQVHQVELEMQNVELQDAGNRMEVQLEKYTDLYDFAPVGYVTLDEQGRILEVNLAGAASLGVERARLIPRRFMSFVAPASQPGFRAFLRRVFAGDGKQFCEAALCKAEASTFWAHLHGIPAFSARGAGKWCRVAFSDITPLKQVEEAQRRIAVLAESNRKLEEEIVHRQAAEASLRESEQHQRRLLERAHRMQEELRHLSRQVLLAQEDERKRISRELHDVIAQTLTGINIRLETLKREVARNPKGVDRAIIRVQRLVVHSVGVVHQFARELRPAVLDDLGLIPALHSFVRLFSKRTRLHVHLKAFAGAEQLDADQRTILYRVALEALTNVARHAKASRVEVNIQKRPDGICMSIQDDGRSFAVERVMKARGHKRLGLLGMRERLEMAGGRFSIESAPGAGTTVTAHLPLPNKRQRQGPS